MLADLRESTVATALRLPALVLDRAGRGDLLSRVGADIAAIGKAVADVLPNVISALLLGLLSLAAMAGIDWRLGLAGAVAVPFYVIALRWYLPLSAPRYAQERKAVAERSQLLVESMQGLRTVHAYRLERRHLEDIERASAKHRDIDVGVFTLFTRFVGRVNRAEFFGLSALLVVGFLLVRDGSVSVGQASAAALLFHRLFNPVSMLLFTFDEIQAARREPRPPGRRRDDAGGAARGRQPARGRLADPGRGELQLRRPDAGAAGREPAPRAGRARRPGRLDRGRQDHRGVDRRGHPAPRRGRGPGRRRAGAGAARPGPWPSSARRRTSSPARWWRTCAWPGRARASPRWPRRWKRSARSPGRRSCRTGWTRRSATADTT
nr:hypothetical protein GCM10020092_091540 [Actinoplanes digitatis]